MQKLYGLFFTVAISIALLFVFFGGPLKEPNKTFFATGGDGLKDYYTATYLVKYDTCYWHSNAMNYPYGENVMFTGSQPSISHILKFISNSIVDISDYTVGILNISMLLSLLLGSIFIYLLLVHFNLPYLYSVFVAIGIIFLSPQIARMGGHFSLSYVFAIPFILYLTAIFHNKPKLWKSILLGLFMLFAFGTHIYMLGFYSFIIILYWVYILFFNKGIGIKKGLFHFTLQFLFPFIILLILVNFTDSVTDRTSYPWGFLYYRAYPESIFLPLGRPYAKFLYSIRSFNHIDWEGFAFVGSVAALGFLVMLIISIRSLTNRNFLQALWPKENPIQLNIFFWISFIALLYSFGLPFIMEMKWLIDYIGPLKQMRGIARFSWIFYYLLNIYVFYLIWNLNKTRLNKYVWVGVVAFSMSILFYDAHYNVKFWSSFLNNKISEISDNKNVLPANQWVSKIEPERYQAVLPIPFFHIGSENIWVGVQQNISASTFKVSMKTGLPTMGVLMSRTSISQTLSTMQLVWEPYRKPNILTHLNPNKDFLVVAKEVNTSIPEPQMNLLNKSTLLYEGEDFNLYSLPFDSLASSFNSIYKREFEAFNQQNFLSHNGFLTTSKRIDFISDSFISQESNIYYFDRGSKSQSFGQKRIFYRCNVPSNVTEENYVLSFWFHGAETDLLLRSQLVVEIADSSTGANYYYETHNIGNLVKIVDNNWALIETTFRVNNPGDELGFWIYNYDLRRKDYTIGQLILRPLTTDIYRKSDNWLMKNNRFYYIED